ncbi:DUF2786 domain-containing protein [Clostridium sp.]|jgi:hypothetical protein|uniref:DUF2786 domain-containing protein n=1 Tax=Clostridium sp. TaxID=1506 RepID=UPI0025B875AE|nr:DUF2786 domain-containing protein [Clostridium sp.]MCI9069958.1 DUF2786 domain-containing protein [Clostridium sp.]
MENDIILKIKKLLALSKSKNENEAHNALMKAQKLLIKHKLSMKEVEEYSNVKLENCKTEETFRGKSWKANLADVLAENLGCYYYFNTREYGVRKVIFYGKQEDAIICKIMYTYAIKCINLDGDKLVKKLKKDKRRKHFDGIKNDYALGFIRGLDEKFKEQIKDNEEWGLILQKDSIVIEGYKELQKTFTGSINASTNFNRHTDVYYKGMEEGKKFDVSDKIEKEGTEEELLHLD